MTTEILLFSIICPSGGMVDPADSKSAVCKDVRVRLSPRAHKTGEVQSRFSYDGITKVQWQGGI